MNIDNSLRIMILIDRILIDENLLNLHFACDLKKCKGSCCTFKSDYGAPLLNEEVRQITDILDKVKPYLSKKSLDIIEKDGFYSGKPGDFSTNSINKRDCVFVYYDGNIAKCAIERAYFEGKISFRKPISCHLFPIRVSEYGGTYLYYQQFEECDPALDKGYMENITLVDFLKDSLKRAYGDNWYEKLAGYSKQANNIVESVREEVL